MRIIIAGGSGLIGRELTSSLLLQGHEVNILSRNPDKIEDTPEGVKVVGWDAKTLGNWVGEIQRSEAVVNLVGENLSGRGLFPSRWTKEQKERLINSRVDAGKVLAKAIEMADIKPVVFIQASGIGIYGTDLSKVFTEDSEPGKDFLAYLSKEWEASSKMADNLDVRRVIIRTGVVLSNNGGALQPLIFPYKFYMGGKIGDGKQVYSWIHITDEVEAIRFLIENDQARGVYNLCSPNPATNNELGRTISSLMNRPHFLTIPSFIMRFVFGEVADMVLKGQRVMPKRLLETGYTFSFPTLAGAMTNLLCE
jgi:hypothetical protein